MASLQHASLSAAATHPNKTHTTTHFITDMTVANTLYGAVPVGFTKLAEVHVVQYGTIATAPEPVSVIDHSDASVLATATVPTGGVAGTLTSVLPVAQSITTGTVYRVTTTGASTGTFPGYVTLVWERAV